MADTCGTLVKAAAVLKENGAKSVLALVTHGILSGNAIETLNGSVLQALVVTNTVPLGDKVERVSSIIIREDLAQYLFFSSALNSRLLTSARQSLKLSAAPIMVNFRILFICPISQTDIPRRIRLIPLHSRPCLSFKKTCGANPGPT